MGAAAIWDLGRLASAIGAVDPVACGRHPASAQPSIRRLSHQNAVLASQPIHHAWRSFPVISGG
jgi:hypothetical protein